MIHVERHFREQLDQAVADALFVRAIHSDRDMSVRLKVSGQHQGRIAHECLQCRRHFVAIDADSIDTMAAQDTSERDDRTNAIAVGTQVADHGYFFALQLLHAGSKLRTLFRKECSSLSFSLSSSSNRSRISAPRCIDGS